MSLPLGAFELLRQVGTGATGEVWEGRHAPTGARVAVKTLKAELSMEERVATTFQNEARAVAALNHPNIVEIYDRGSTSPELQRASQGQILAGRPYLVMEWASGQTLDQRERATSWPELRDILLALLGALAHAHAMGVLHRDIKPANVLICTADDLRPGLKLADFGLARPVDPGRQARRMAGTPHYMAPEQWQTQGREQGPWTDLYALACLAWKLATGKTPYLAKTVDKMKRAHLEEPLPALALDFEAPAGLQDWLHQGLAKSPRDRFRNAAQAAHALRRLDAPETPFLPAMSNLAPAGAPPAPLRGAGLGLYGLRTLPLVDRDAERQDLWGSLARVRRDGHVLVRVLRGPAGNGKSRLAEWLGRLALERGVADFYWGGFNGDAQGLPGMVARALRCIGLEHDRNLVRAAASSWLTLHGGEGDWEVETLAALAVPPREGEDAAVRFAESGGRMGALRRFLKRATHEGPLVLWLDDVQWGPDALSLVETLLEKPARLPVLVLLTAQEEALAEEPEAAARLEALAQDHRGLVESRELGPLPDADGAALAGQLLGMDGELAQEVARRSAGNPLYAVQLVADWVHRGALEPGASGFQLAEEALLEAPQDLRQVWNARISSFLDERPPDDRRALEIAAVLGAWVEPPIWTAACERAWAIPSPDLVEALLAARLARCGEDGPSVGWSFEHGMLRDALRAGAEAGGRLRTYHRVVAETLQEVDAVGRAEALAHHLIAARRAAAALPHLLSAAQARLSRREFGPALRLLDSLEEAAEAAAVSGQDARRMDALLVRAELALRQGQLQEAARLARMVEEVARRLKWEARLARALHLRGEILLLEGAPAAALPLLTEAETRARGMGLLLLVETLLARAEALRRTGSLEPARELLEEARDKLQESGDQRRSGEVCIRLYRLARDASDLADARLWLEAGLVRLDQCGAVGPAIECLQGLAELCDAEGRRSEAQSLRQEANLRARALELA